MKTPSRALSLVTIVLMVGSSALQELAAAPGIQSISPAPGATVSNLSQIAVTFSAPVVGVQAADLQINGTPALARTLSGSTITFQFSQPSPGGVSIAFDSDAVISDQVGGLFDPLGPGTSWAYTVADTIAPTVNFAEPAFGAVVGGLTQIEVVFKEPVSGVDAADLLINGVAATSLTALAPDRYRFGFAAPAQGIVNLNFSVAHGIKDLSPAANAFPGQSWTYSLTPSGAVGDVVINEFLAENQHSLEDEDGQQEDWIELRNRGTGSVNLTGWSLTDDPNEPGKWTFPNLTLGAGQYLIVFASGKDRKPTAAGTTNHTNFRLGLDGGYLGLFSSGYPRVAVSQFNTYPAQRADISYGLAGNGAATYFSTLTPRAANNAASVASGFVAPPHTSVRSGFFDQPFNLVLSSETPGAQVRYTLDGSVPTPASESYVGPIPIAGVPTKAVVTVRAVGFKAGHVPSSVTTRTYIFPDHVLTQPANPAGFPSIWDSPCTGFNNCNDINPADYEMDPQVITNTVDNYRVLARQGLVAIPTVSIVTDVNSLFSAGQGVYVRREPFLRKPINAEFITTDGTEGFQIDCGLEMQGQTSPDDSSTGGSKWKSLKLGLRLFFQGQFGPTKLNYKVFEDSPVDSFDTLMLAGGHNNYWNYNNNDTQRTRSTYVRDQFVANLQNAMGGRSHHGRFVHLYLNGLYWGLYQLHERPDESFQASYFGGDKSEYDVFKHDAVSSGNIVAGSTASYTTMWGVINAGLANNANYEQLQQSLDVPDLIHYMLANQWANNTDWAHKNLYGSHRKQNGRWRFHAWDSEHVLATSANDFDAMNDNEGTNPGAIFTRLLNNREFRVLLGDHIHRHFFNGGVFYTDPANPIYNPAFPERNRPAQMFMSMLQTIDTAIVCESARWGDVGPGRETTPHTRNTSFYEERDILLGNRATFGAHSPVFFPTRSTALLTEFRTRGWYPTVVAPSFNQHGGRVASGFNLSMSAPAGTIYYTTNGTDPRVYASAAVSPHARTYSASVALNNTVQIKSRSLVGTNWSALNEATFTVAELTSPLRITEIMYNPVGGDAFEFLELQNTGGLPINLTGYFFEGLSFAFGAGASIGPGATIVLANNNNPALFAARYPGVVVADYFGGSLANSGERISLKNAAGQSVVSVDYHDNGGWPIAADGGGSSLELIDLNGPSSEPANWQASGANGSPGQPNPAPAASTIVINEVGADNPSAVANAGTFPDWIELANRSASPVNVEGWSLSDDGNARKFVFPTGATIPANGYLVVWCDAATNVTPGLHAGFALDRGGDSVFLYNAQIQRVDAVSFGSQVPDLTLGRIGNEWTLTSPTPSAANVSAATAPASSLSINEWLANATPGTDDWLELYNRSTTLPVSLRGAHLSSGGVIVQIRSLSYLAAGGFVQLLADEGGGPNHLDFKLSATGGDIALYDPAAVLVENITYGAQLEGISQGRLPNGSATVIGFPGSVTPGASNYVANYTGPFLSEVMARNFSAPAPWAGYADWIELANASGAPVDIGGLGLSDSLGGDRWLIPAGTIISANGFLRVWCDPDRVTSTTGGADMNSGFALSGQSGGVYLFNAGGQLVDSVDYGFQVADLTLGRTGGIATPWRLLTSPTPGSANSAPASLGTPTGLKVNEWMSEPNTGNDWFELFNPSPQPVDLTGLYLTDDPSVYGVTQFKIAPLSFIGAGGFVSFDADGDASQGRHHVNFSLDRLGEALRIYGTNLALIDTVDLLAYPSGLAAGRVPDGSSTITTFPTSASRDEPNYLPLVNVVVQEVLTHTDLPLRDSIELHNPTAQAINISSYFLSDSPRNLKKFRIPDGTTIPAGGYIVFEETHFNTGAPGSFALSSSHGGTVHLSAADAGGTLSGFRSVAPFGPQVNGVSFGRLPTSVGVDYVATTTRTLGTANAAPRVGPITFNEIQYHPIDGPLNLEDDAHEFIELHNLSASAVPMFDPANPGNTWRVSGGVNLQFPPGISIPPRGYLVLVSFDPLSNTTAAEAFRTKYGLPGSIPLLGPFSGRLANAGEELVLEMPDTPQTGAEAGYVPSVVVDRLGYGPVHPWPMEADGQGGSLQRRRTYAYGNDPLNWKGAPPTAGRANVLNSTFVDTDQDGLPDAWETANGLNAGSAADAQLDRDGDGHSNYEEYLDGTDLSSAASRLDAPVIVTQPSDASGSAGQTVILSIDISSGAASLLFQWSKNGFPIPGEMGPTLTLGPLTQADSATYSVTVWNGAGFVVSRSARVTVNIPPRITLQPVGLIVNPGSNVTFTVAATGTGLIRYQWQLDGQDIAGATSPTLAVPNAQLVNEGEYAVLVTDDLTTIRSQTVRLVVRVAPVIVTQPKGATNAVGGTAIFTVTATGSVPMGFTWRKGVTPIATFVISNRAPNYTSTFAISNLTLADNGLYRVVITNAGNASPGVASPQVTNSVIEATLPLRLSGLQVLPNGQAQMNISGTPNRTYFIEASPNLSNWTTIGPITYTNGLMPFLDTTAVGVTNRFYRGRQ